MVGGAVVGGAVVGGAVVGGAVVGGAVVGGTVVGDVATEVGLVAPPDGDPLVAEWVGADVDFPGAGVDLPPPPAVGLVPAVGCACGVGMTTIGARQETWYVAGWEAAATGLVTTSTASPVAGSCDGVILSGGTVLVPAALNASVRTADFWPSASAQ